jgi:hypothetical protein
VTVLERIDESRLEVSGALLSFMDGQTRSNPHAIEDGQQVIVLPEPELICNEWNERLFYRKNQ